MFSIMCRFGISSLFAAMMWLVAAFPASAANPLPVDQAFKLTAAKDGQHLTLNWTIQPGNYLYREKIGLRQANGAPVPFTTEDGEQKDDPTFGQTEVYWNHAKAIVDLANVPARGNLIVTYQGCAEDIICYPPQTVSLNTATLAVTDAPGAPGLAKLSAALDQMEWSNLPAEVESAPAAPAGTGSQSDTATSAFSGSLAFTLFTFLGFGLLLALTPCVFPMIPILSGMLVRSGEHLSAGRGFVLSTSYVLAMASAYAVIGVVAAWSGQNLQLALQTPIAVGIMSLVFVALALSMFGLFDLQMPATWSARLSSATSGKGGSIGGAAVLGFGSALIVGPCVTPPLAAALLYVAQTSDVMRGGLALFALGLGMGLPLIGFGIFGSRLLPKSGPWLAQIKNIFGYIFLGLAIAMISRALPANLAVGFWALFAIGIGTFIGAFDRLDTSEATPAGALGQRLAKAAGIASVVYGVILLAGFAGGATDPMRPLSFLERSGTGLVAEAKAEKASIVTSSPAFDAALATARTAGKPVLVQFTAEWCTVCKQIERDVLSNPAVRQRLANFSVITADVTDYGDNSRELMKRFSIVGPPTMLVLDPATGGEIGDTRTIGAITVDEFTRKLDHAGA